MSTKKMHKEIKINCTGSDTILLDEMEPLQGNLKNLSDENKEKLKASILKHGFTAPVFIWKTARKKYIIDSHSRKKVLEELRDEGYNIPPLPCIYIVAKTKKHAKEILLKITSNYGKVTKEGLIEFSEDLNIKSIIEQVSLIGSKIDVSVIMPEDIKIDNKDISEIKLKNKCPSCGHEW
jgi:hypothetical protein